MEKRERINSFGWNLFAVICLFALTCLVSILIRHIIPTITMQYGLPVMLAWYLAIGASIPAAFFCGLLLKGEDIRSLVRERGNVALRKGWIVLSIVTIFLAGVEIWIPVFSYFSGGRVLGSLFWHRLASDHHGDIVLGAAAALFLVGAFQLSQGAASKVDERKKSNVGLMIWNLFAVLCVLVSIYQIYKFNWYLLENHPDYGRYGLSTNKWNTLPREYYVILARIGVTFACALLFQGEQIVKIVQGRRNLLFRWEMLILSAMSLLFAHMYFWLPRLILNLGLTSYLAGQGAGATIMGYFIPGYFSKAIFAFASAVLIVRAFHVKTLSSDLQDGLGKEGERL